MRLAAAVVLVVFGLTIRTSAVTTGLVQQQETQLSPRLTEMRLYSPALARDTKVRVLTPAGFDASRDHLPVLWLLHGGFGNAANWTDAGAEAVTEGLPLIVVMPDGGIGGWYSDWLNIRTGQPGLQRWESYHVRELMPFIEGRYQTRTDRSGHAIAGLSMGGFGAMHYAARHPDLYGFAASFSGAVDIIDPFVGGVVTISPLAHGGIPNQIFGDRVADATRWRANNPVDLAANLRMVTMQLRTGNGQPGGPHGGGFDIQEVGVSRATASLHNRLIELGVPHLYDDYGPGAHNFDYWIDDLRKTLPGVMAATAAPMPVPSTVDHVAYEPSFSVWGFDVALNRQAPDETVISIRPDGFGLRGRGAGTVTTPARYSPGQRVRATTTYTDRRTVAVLVAGAAGRLVVGVDLGPADVLRRIGVVGPPGNINVTLEPEPPS